MTLTEYTREGLTFDVIDRGTADRGTVVLLHGFPQTSASWSAVSERLNAEGYRTLVPDQRGYSPRARPRGRFAYRTGELVADVAALIDASGDAPVHLVGHDWGSLVAWALSAERPETVASLTAVCVPHPAAFLQSMLSSDQLLRSWYMAAFQVPWLPELAVSDPHRLRSALAGTGMRAAEIDAVQRDVVEAGALTGALNWYRAMALSTPGRLRRRVTVPTFMVAGAQDTALGVRGAQLSERYVDAPFELHILDEAGHWIPEQQPAELAALILQNAGR